MLLPSRCSASSARALGPGRARSCRRWMLPLGPASPPGEIQLPGVVPGQGGDRPLGIREEVLVARGEGVGPVGDEIGRASCREREEASVDGAAGEKQERGRETRREDELVERAKTVSSS